MPDVGQTGRPGRQHRHRSSPTARRALLILALLCSSLGGCPRPFDAAATPSVESKDPQANRAFRQAKQQFDDGSHVSAFRAFGAFLARFASDPLAPLARVYLGRIAVRQGNLAAAREHLAAVAGSGGKTSDAVTLLARYHLGLVEVRLGSYAAGQRWLLPLLEAAGDETRPAVLVALARATEGLKDRLGAARRLDRLHAETTRETERLYARHNLERLVDLLSAAEARSVAASDKTSSLLFALTARRLIAESSARGDLDAAQRLRARSSEARTKHGVGTVAPAGGEDGPIGLLVPFTGRFRSVGKLALAGAAFGASAFEAGKAEDSRQPALVIRDSSRRPAQIARELITRARVVALVGVLDPGHAAAVARVAREHRVPFLSLSSAAPASAANTTLRLLPTNEQRAKLLARRVLARHRVTPKRGTPSHGTPPRVAIFAPDSRYGRTMARAFAAETTRGGGRVVTQRFYPTGIASFTAQAKALGRASFDTLFIPDSSRRLALIAPALALAGIWPTSPGAPPAKGRAIQLAATADGLSATLLDRAGRYVQGALLAPGFYPDPNAALNGALVRRYQQAHGRAPGLVEAFACDGVGTVRAHLRQGARGRASLLAALRARAATGLTGKVRFSRQGRRADPPLIYQVRGSKIGLLSE